MGFTLDTGAFIALEKRKTRAWRFIELADADGLDLRAPADVLVEFWRGGAVPKPLLTLIDSAVQWIDVTPGLAKRAGRALEAASRGPSAVDALVATVAAAFGDTVLTSDVGDFDRLRRHYRSLKVLGV